MADIAITDAGLRAAWNADGTGLDFSVTYFKLGASNPTPDENTTESDLGYIEYPASGNNAEITSTVQITPTQYEFRILLDSSIGPFTFQSIGLYLNNGTGGGVGTLFAVIVLDDDFTKTATSGSDVGNTFRLHVPISFNESLDALEITNIADPAPARIVEVADLESLGKASDAGTRDVESASYAHEFTLPSGLPDDGAVVATIHPRPASMITIKQGDANTSVTSSDSALTEGSSGSDKGLVIVGTQVKIATSGTRYGAGTVVGGREIRIEYDSTKTSLHNVYLVQDLNILAHVPIDTDGNQWNFDGYHYVGDIDIASIGGSNPENLQVTKDNLTSIFPISKNNDYDTYMDGDLIIQTTADSTVGLVKRVQNLTTTGANTDNVKLEFTRSDGPAHDMENNDTIALYARDKAIIDAQIDALEVPHKIEVDELSLDNKYITPDILGRSRIYARGWATFRGTYSADNDAEYLFDDYNVSSLNDLATGQFSVRWENSMPNNVYTRVAQGSAGRDPDVNTSTTTIDPRINIYINHSDRNPDFDSSNPAGLGENQISNNFCRVECIGNDNNAYADPVFASIAVFGSDHRASYNVAVEVQPVAPSVVQTIGAAIGTTTLQIKLNPTSTTPGDITVIATPVSRNSSNTNWEVDTTRITISEGSVVMPADIDSAKTANSNIADAELSTTHSRKIGIHYHRLQ